MSDFNNNLNSKLNKQQLRQKLKSRIASKQNKRTSKIVRKQKDNKVRNQVRASFNPENSQHIRHAAVCLMKDVGQLVKKGIINPVRMNEQLAKKYKFLIDTRFPIYMGILKGELPLPVLDMMISQKDRIDAKEISEVDASLEVGSVFAKKLNVDVDALVKSAKENKAKLESESN